MSTYDMIILVCTLTFIFTSGFAVIYCVLYPHRSNKFNIFIRKHGIIPIVIITILAIVGYAMSKIIFNF